MLYFVGLGLEQSPTLKAVSELRQCGTIYYENYTSPELSQEVVNKLSEAIGESSKIETVSREFVEDGRKILDVAKETNVALVCSGDPMVATTHEELRTRALKQNVPTRIIHGSSILCAAGGELGLHSYNFGRTVTMTRDPMQYTAYQTIFRNLLGGLHTVLLLEWDKANNFFLEPRAAANSLLDAERDLKQEIFGSETLVFIVSRIGSDEVRVSMSDSLEGLEDMNLGRHPHVLVIPGKLHFTEREALGALFGKDPGSFRDNSSEISRLSTRMVTKYSLKTLNALARAKKAAALASNSNVNFSDIFENVECYTQDAQRFLNEGKEELAVLSIGYAEGLLDSLRFGGQLEFEW
jgi:diphthine synthase